MSEPTYIACPRCGEPFPMSAMQKRLYIGRTLSCNRCAKPFAITEDTPDPVPAPNVRPSPFEPLAPVPVPVPQQAAPPAAAGPAPVAAGSSKMRMPGETDGLTAGRMALL